MEIVEASSGFPLRPVSQAFRSVMDHAPVPVMCKDPDGYFVYVNPLATSLFGYGLEELIGTHITEVVQADRVWVISEFERLKTQQSWTGQYLMRCQAGDLVPVKVNAFGCGARGGAIAYSCLYHPVQDSQPSGFEVSSYQAQDQVTSRELCLLSLMAEGFVNKEMARILGVSVFTVDKDVSLILDKLGATSRTEACVKAIKAKLIC